MYFDDTLNGFVYVSIGRKNPRGHHRTRCLCGLDKQLGVVYFDDMLNGLMFNWAT